MLSQKRLYVFILNALAFEPKRTCVLLKTHLRF